MSDEQESGVFRKNRILASMKLEQVVGERRYGHSDHDASRASGPQRSRYYLSNHSSNKKKTRKNPAVSFEKICDPITGRIRYLKKLNS